MALSKLRLGQLKPADGSTTVGEVHFPKNILHLPFDGSNGATSTSDLSNQNHTVTFNGAQISSAQSKFGGTSLLLDGSNDYLTIGGSEWNSNLNSGDFTVEFWIRLDALGDSRIITNYNGSNGWGLAMWSGGGGTNYFDAYWYSGSWRYVQYGQSGTYTTPSVDTWYHLAFVRNGDDWSLYLNGTAENTITVSGSIASSSLGALELGRRYLADQYVDGYIDDLRITKGLARYTSNFTPPTSAHLTSAGDVNKHIVINSDADGVAIGTGGINQARIAKAWVNFDGSGTVSIRDSYNIASVTDNGTGDWTLNYSTAMSNTSYVVFGNGANVTGVSGTVMTQTWTAEQTTPFTTSASRVISMFKGGDGANSAWDAAYLYFITFGN